MIEPRVEEPVVFRRIETRNCYTKTHFHRKTA